MAQGYARSRQIRGFRPDFINLRYLASCKRVCLYVLSSPYTCCTAPGDLFYSLFLFFSLSFLLLLFSDSCFLSFFYVTEGEKQVSPLLTDDLSWVTRKFSIAFTTISSKFTDTSFVPKRLAVILKSHASPSRGIFALFLPLKRVKGDYHYLLNPRNSTASWYLSCLVWWANCRFDSTPEIRGRVQVESCSASS